MKKNNLIYSKITFVFIIMYTSTINLSFAQNPVNSSTTEILKNTYIQITGSCNWAHIGGCVAARSGPGTSFSKEHRLRNGIVLKVSEKIEIDDANKSNYWYKVDFKNEKINKIERVKTDWYVNAKYTKILKDVSPEVYNENNQVQNDNKKIYINLKKQTLEAYDGDTLFMKTKISSGLTDSPTESGEYFIHYKTPSRYMQDSATSTKIFYTATSTEILANGENKISTSTKFYATSTKGIANYKDYYDLPGVPFDMYFSEDGSAIHGSYWHNNFGRRHSHGCINLNLKDSEKLYSWSPVGIAVIIK